MINLNQDEGVRYAWWKDDKVVSELKQLSGDLKSGKEKGATWEDVKAAIRPIQKGRPIICVPSK
ncbi:hypothetical protein [Mucilaginibacter myungsuensis]|uniref:Uncharacterized protein n=1 Tax=Mucilaginibacter myungsuensis TaxID=649104 RepID=A0A929KVN0_9SPHI|nr:hypothetical protein [Mucilaginibacter myungsuensis]MBE9662441.1 hypothetical protein [Mucilaginibacter myungsuensis]MDN3599122.1 hypothetical protein [Mucilaginibacter myungsuensis]